MHAYFNPLCRSRMPPTPHIFEWMRVIEACIDRNVENFIPPLISTDIINPLSRFDPIKTCTLLRTPLPHIDTRVDIGTGAFVAFTRRMKAAMRGQRAYCLRASLLGAITLLGQGDEKWPKVVDDRPRGLVVPSIGHRVLLLVEWGEKWWNTTARNELIWKLRFLRYRAALAFALSRGICGANKGSLGERDGGERAEGKLIGTKRLVVHKTKCKGTAKRWNIIQYDGGGWYAGI